MTRVPSPDSQDVVQMEVEDAIDLHTFQPRDIVSVVDSYLEAAVEKGYHEVRLIHGRGKGVQRARIRQLLSIHPLVIKYTDASPSRGGHGATLVWLVERRPPSKQTVDEQA